MKSQNRGLILKDRPSSPLTQQGRPSYPLRRGLRNGLIYLYCFTNKIPKLKEVESLVSELHFIYYSGLYAVVSKVSSEFSEENLKKKLSDFEWVKLKVSIHEKIIEGIMKYASVVPFKFATLFNTEDSLKAMLNKHIKVVKENLNNLKGKEEWGIKIYCDIEKLKDVLSQKDEEILKLDKEIVTSLPGKAFILKKKKEEFLKDIVNRRINDYGKQCFEQIEKQTIESRINKLLPKVVTERKEDMILNSAFLVEKDRVKAFVSVIDILKAEYANKGLFFDCTGPWPPYNFCLLEEKKE